MTNLITGQSDPYDFLTSSFYREPSFHGFGLQFGRPFVILVPPGVPKGVHLGLSWAQQVAMRRQSLRTALGILLPPTLTLTVTAFDPLKKFKISTQKI